jgi:diphosphomevalonate decarboxylase
MVGEDLRFRVESSNNFPVASGIASSASAFAALSLASTDACGLHLDEQELSRLARTGSGSACRSIPGGFVEWYAGDSHETSYATSFAPPDYWDLCDCVAVLSVQPKPASSTIGHSLAITSPLQNARLEGVTTRLDQCRKAILNKDFEALSEVIEIESNLMHAVMMTSSPPLFYWLPGTLALIQTIRAWRAKGIPVCYTIDAGPNVHVICPGEIVDNIRSDLEAFPGVSMVLVAHPGGPTRLET